LDGDIKLNQIHEKIIHVTEGIELSLGGTTQFIISLCDALYDKGFQAEIWAPKRSDADISLKNKIVIRQFEIGMPKFMYRCKNFYTSLKNLNPKPALIHQHGLWLDPYRVAAKFARQYKIPHIISLHGMLEPWSLKRSQWKKRLAWLAFQGRDIRLASCLHVATEREAENIRKLGIKTPVAVIPNGIQVAGVRSQESEASLHHIDFYPELRNKRIILFLGRIHPVKGLDFFAKVWKKIADDFPDWQWVIAGPDEDNYQSELQILFEQLGISNQITFVGTIAGEKKSALLRASDLLILPSYLESFGIVVLEALNEGVPVMASTNCPWSDLEIHGCGWWLKQDVTVWESALRKVMSMNHETLKAFGIKGKSLVKKKYSQDNLVNSMTELYNRLLYRGE